MKFVQLRILTSPNTIPIGHRTVDFFTEQTLPYSFIQYFWHILLSEYGDSQLWWQMCQRVVLMLFMTFYAFLIMSVQKIPNFMHCSQEQRQSAIRKLRSEGASSLHHSIEDFFLISIIYRIIDVGAVICKKSFEMYAPDLCASVGN